MPALFLLVGVGAMADGFDGGRPAPDELLKGLGFMLMAPDAHLHPINLSAPLKTLLKPQPSVGTNRPAQYVAMVGFALVVAGLLAGWL